MATVSLTVEDLKYFGATPKLLAGRGYSVQLLQKLGFDLTKLAELGFDLSELRKVFGVPAFRAAGYKLPALVGAGFSPSSLRDAGFSAADLMGSIYKVAGVQHAQHVINGTYVEGGLHKGIPYYAHTSKGSVIYPYTEDGQKVRWCIASGVGATGNNVFAHIDSAVMAPPEGSWAIRSSSGGTGDPRVMHARLFTVADLSGNVVILAKVSKLAKTLPSTVSLVFKKVAESSKVFDACELLSAGCRDSELRSAGYTITQLIQSGCRCTVDKLIAAGFSHACVTRPDVMGQLLKSGYTVAQLQAIGYQAASLHNPQIIAHMIKSAYGIHELQVAGYMEGYLKQPHIVVQCLRSGCSIDQLRTAGYTDECLLGCMAEFAESQGGQLREARCFCSFRPTSTLDASVQAQGDACVQAKDNTWQHFVIALWRMVLLFFRALRK
eukprot:TRINITY_DN59168_c0_g1_i1.p1 TRINITY_DN59168_c0_g1~~TRINITY_DN59168_c0_g1_i1.p1  ORF type:complete len:437 (+),score=45.43 TRINITY_DN59168_c0_g1_i1:64-1374(+)